MREQFGQFHNMLKHNQCGKIQIPALFIMKVSKKLQTKLHELNQNISELNQIIKKPVGYNLQTKMEDYEEIITSVQMLYQQYIIINAEVM